jgi:RecJ-like exonuclease
MSNYPPGAEHDPNAPYNEVDLGTKECPNCNGEGYWLWSDCGVDMKDTIDESDLCPKCHEHQGEEEDMKEVCIQCEGDGVVHRTSEDIADEKEQEGWEDWDELWSNGDIDPAGGHGPSSHI